MRIVMTSRTPRAAALLVTAALPGSGRVSAQDPFPGGRGGPGGFGGPNQPERTILAQFDKDKDKRLNAVERHEARLWMESQPGAGRGSRGPGGPGGFGGRGGGMTAGTPGPKLTPAALKTFTKESLYDPAVLRTLFFQFENDDWEQEMMAFYNTDVEVPATLVVDGRTYQNVGLHFRGPSSFVC